MITMALRACAGVNRVSDATVGRSMMPLRVSSESFALKVSPAAVRADQATRPSATLPTWDVRATRVVNASFSDELLNRLLAKGAREQVLATPAVMRSAPAVASRVLGSLYSVRLPVSCRKGRMSANGYLEFVPVTTGLAEIGVCLSSARRWKG